MIIITQVLRPGQFKLHREAARRLWKLCSKHCSIASILHFAGKLLHISQRADLAARHRIALIAMSLAAQELAFWAM